MRIERRYTKEGQSPYADIEFRLTTSEIRNPDGSVVFRADDVEVPDVLVAGRLRRPGAEVFPQGRRAGAAQEGRGRDRPVLAVALGRPTRTALAALPEKERNVGERSSKQVFDRLAGTWTYWGWKAGYFDSEADARAFFDELACMLALQMVAPNSPQWFNTGLHWAYGIDGPSQGHYYVDHKTGKLTKSKSAYEHPQPHACFIQSINDDLVNEGGIMDLWVREARLFKYGSGTGSNFSRLRGEGEKLSGGGKSSGLMSFLKIGDRAAGAIKSGGTTRRAAKMVIVDVDHPDIEKYIDWKVNEEQKVAALVTGSKINQKHLKAVMKACVNCEGSGDDCFDPTKNPVLRREIKAARRMCVPDNFIKRVIQFARQGYTDIDFPIYDTDWDSEAYLTVSGQNSNNSVRVTDEFLKAVEADGDWDLTWRTKGGKVAKTVKARDLWEKIAYAAWASADPGLQYHTTINDWHTCPASGPIRASNPCSEYMFLDDTACNLASLNLLAFRNAETRQFDVEGYEHAVRLWTIVLEISVLMAQFPSQGDRAALLRVPHARPRLRQYRRPADVVRHPLRFGGRPRAVRRALRHHDRRLLRDLGRDGGRARRLPGLQEEPRAHAARDPQPSPRRARREDGLRAHRHPAGAARPRRLRRAHRHLPGPRRARRARLGQGAGARRGARLPQRPDDGDRADRHDRPGDGLRHHRHRARLRAGEVQEARRRRLLQDHQPRRAGGAARARLLARPRSPRSRSMRSATARSARRPASTTPRSRPRASTDEAIAKVEKALPTAFDIKFAFNKWTLGEDFCRDDARHPGRGAGRAQFRPARPHRLHQARDRRRQHPCLRRHDGRGRAAPQGRALCGVRLRQSVRPHRQALSVGREPHPHDGGGAALHLRRHLQDHQHAERGDGRGLQGGLSAVVEARPQGQRALPRRLEAVAAARTRS